MSDTATGTTTPDTGTTTQGTDAAAATDTAELTAAEEAQLLRADVERWRGLARKHEDRAKANAQAAKDLDKVRQESMTEQERAVAAARAEARVETLREVGMTRVDDAVRLAAVGRHDDVDALLEGLDRTRFLDEDGQPDVKAITAWVDRVAPAREEAPSGFPDLGQGARTSLPLNGDPLLRDVKDKLGIR